jgi:hypothetical protein
MNSKHLYSHLNQQQRKEIENESQMDYSSDEDTSVTTSRPSTQINTNSSLLQHFFTKMIHKRSDAIEQLQREITVLNSDAALFDVCYS